MSLGGILAGVGGLMGGLSAMGASNAASEAQASLIRRQSGLFDLILKQVKQADQQGQFNPNAQISQLSADLNRQAGIETGNAAGAARVLGYQPGDSEPQRQQEAIGSKYQFQFADLAQQIRQSAFQQKLAAYSAPNPGSLNAGISAYGANAQSLRPDMGGLFSSLAPYLAGKPAASPNPYATGGAGGTGMGGGGGTYAGTGDEWTGKGGGLSSGVAA